MTNNDIYDSETALHDLMEEFKDDCATNDPAIILSELDLEDDDELRERIMSIARDAVDYPPIAQWYREVLELAARRYAERAIGEIEAEPEQRELP